MKEGDWRYANQLQQSEVGNGNGGTQGAGWRQGGVLWPYIFLAGSYDRHVEEIGGEEKII